MTNQEMLAALKGDRQVKLNLFNQMVEQVQSGLELSDDQLPIFEALKKELMVKPQVVQLEANLVGSSSAKGG
jgi:hypothetical protein